MITLISQKTQAVRLTYALVFSTEIAKNKPVKIKALEQFII